ncbi:DUF3199 family protein [Aneurinibacillus aneurinilyticus]|uniref:Uncharacterized protein n=1 Tax=Aneurinibacillus aneurinilyticus ATCC 12856 TaxID=649747 RepID=U1X6S3_ANEAE|nr:DUF3199 family protein [Aneurinibacillus aneurinilyticus]ERI10233.1 hypothetical protein HMPREF0083_01677 [Aneurinibacillus aneurinilyticus ATCC 12856]MED0705861.1 DUF3199 family protein [Aneurinibacillus aneurinilyticus]MED0722664.1 DUF3199 family protein [Aneurinibacillus aneurinilyticus]MED0731416.1 DUF3199 family protein [Aneurinibacillus aneurinilyticus]MED0740172.1 DUF3199 family protein [Aneurinibacillus aneurinilyticus]
MLTPELLKNRSRVSTVQGAGEDLLQQYIDDAQTRIELFLPVPFPQTVDRQMLLAWVKLAEGLALQDDEAHLAAVARGYTAENDGAWSYTRQAVEGKTTGNPDVDNILRLWLKKQSPTDGNIQAMVL